MTIEAFITRLINSDIFPLFILLKFHIYILFEIYPVRNTSNQSSVENELCKLEIRFKWYSSLGSLLPRPGLCSNIETTFTMSNSNLCTNII